MREPVKSENALFEAAKCYFMDYLA
jgi:hypothetical protein